MPKYAKSMSANPQSVKVSYSSHTGEACLDPRAGKSNIGSLVTPPGAPPPSSKGSITPPTSPVGGK